MELRSRFKALEDLNPNDEENTRQKMGKTLSKRLLKNNWPPKKEQKSITYRGEFLNSH